MMFLTTASAAPYCSISRTPRSPVTTPACMSRAGHTGSGERGNEEAPRLRPRSSRSWRRQEPAGGPCPPRLLSDQPPMCLAEAELPLGEPREARARLAAPVLEPGRRRIGDLAAHPVHMGEELRILAAAAAEREVEAPPGEQGDCKAQERIAGVAGDDLVRRPRPERRMKIAPPHPAWRVLVVDGLHRAEHRIRPVASAVSISSTIQSSLAVSSSSMKARKSPRRIIQAGIAGNRDVGGWAMHIDDLVRHDGAQGDRRSPSRARAIVIVGHDDADCRSVGHGDRASERSVCSSSGRR